MREDSKWLTETVARLRANGDIRFDADILKRMGGSKGTLSSYLKGTVAPSRNFIEKFKEVFDQELKNLVLKQDNSAKMLSDGHLMYVPLVNQYAYAGYLGGYGDTEYVADLPKIPYLVNKEYRGNYVCFEVRGDSMDDGTRDSYCQGDIILCREIQPDHWRNPLHIKDWDFVIVHDDSIVVKRIVEHDTDKGTIQVHSLNPLYEDFIIRLQDVKQLFNVIKHTRNK